MKRCTLDRLTDRITSDPRNEGGLLRPVGCRFTCVCGHQWFLIRHTVFEAVGQKLNICPRCNRKGKGKAGLK